MIFLLQTVSNDVLEPQFMEPDRQKMIEKIVKLQKINARKNEKLDFCQDHICQLIEEVQKKTRCGLPIYISRVAM